MEKRPFIVISQTNPDPMYKQVVDQIRDAIATGSIGPEEKLPSIRELSKALSLSPITIKRAYSDLESEGYIVTRSGMGSFAAELNMDMVHESKIAETREALKRVMADAARYGIAHGEIRRIVSELEEEIDE